jgi:hypothetical protein
MSRLMGVPEALPARLFPPMPVERGRHLLDCGCLTCSDRRAEWRRRGYQPMPARDWRGEALR